MLGFKAMIHACFDFFFPPLFFLFSLWIVPRNTEYTCIFVDMSQVPARPLRDATPTWSDSPPPLWLGRHQIGRISPCGKVLAIGLGLEGGGVGVSGINRALLVPRKASHTRMLIHKSIQGSTGTGTASLCSVVLNKQLIMRIVGGCDGLRCDLFLIA